MPLHPATIHAALRKAGIEQGNTRGAAFRVRRTSSSPTVVVMGGTSDGRTGLATRIRTALGEAGFEVVDDPNIVSDAAVHLRVRRREGCQAAA